MFAVLVLVFVDADLVARFGVLLPFFLLVAIV
jgi:hypothetical protein